MASQDIDKFMEDFFLWQPTLVSKSPALVQVYITPAESNKIGRGDQKLVDSVTGAAGLPTTKDWSLHPFRSTYYAEFLDGEFADRWPISWLLALRYPHPPEPPRLDNPVGINVKDSTYGPSTSYEQAKALECRVIGEFKKRLVDVTDLVGSLHGNGLWVTLPNGLNRIELMLGEWTREDYASGLAEAEKLVAAIEKAGGSTNHSTTFRLLNT